MALRDPELMAAAASAVGVDALAAIFQGAPPLDEQQQPPSPPDPCYQLQPQPHEPLPHRTTKDDDVAMMRQQEVKLAHL